MMEAGVLVSVDGTPLHWHIPPNRSGGALPDSRDLWDVIWENRERVEGFAHTHPGSGVPCPSHEDLTTFVAVEKALGRKLTWWIASSDHLISLRSEFPGVLPYYRSVVPEVLPESVLAPIGDPRRYRQMPLHMWLGELRRLSNY